MPKLKPVKPEVMEMIREAVREVHDDLIVAINAHDRSLDEFAQPRQRPQDSTLTRRDR